ncbi:hypothetical protein PA10_00147 [Pseudomonas phage pPa_SNUABM_DT01]|nr:hypothetical protein PA10_00147 [Pseudomonas phage pPa_SNUABM_DT01]
MAVNNDETLDTGAGSEQPRRNEPRGEPRGERRETNMNAGLLDINRLLGAPMSRRISGEVLVNAVKAIKHWFAPERQVAGGGLIDLTKIQVLGLEASEHNVSISSAILAYPVEENGTVKVLVHSIALAQSLTDDVGVRTAEINHRSYTLPVIPSDYITESYLALIDEIVKKNFEQSRKNVEIVRAGWRVVSPKVDFSEPENTEVRQVVFFAQAALAAIYGDLYNENLYFSLDWLTKASTLEINVDLSGREVFTADGLPRRSDLAVQVAGIVRKGDQNIPVPLANLGGYVNIMYTPPAQEERWARNQRRDQPYFTPVYVINRMDTGTNGITPELLLLAMAGASVISKDQAWAQGFLPGDVQRGEVDYRDAGLLNILGPDQDKQPVVFDSRSSLDTNKWAQYFFSLVDDNLAWAIELEEGGDNSWITSLLSDAATDDSPNKDAIRRLYDYADRLTNGNFTRRAKELGVEVPLQMSGARYLTGTWIDENGKERDLRDWDLLRWMASNPSDEGESALRYQDVIDRTDLDVEIRVSEQFDQLTQALGASNVKFARYVDLAFINPAFIEALAMAVADCKINIDQRSAHYTFGNRRLRGNTRIRDFVGGDLTHGMLSSRRMGNDGQRGLRSVVGNGFGFGNTY